MTDQERASGFVRYCADNGKLALAMSWTPELTEALAAEFQAVAREARTAALEEAAKACEANYTSHIARRDKAVTEGPNPKDAAWLVYGAVVARSLAEAIRAKVREP